MTAAVHRTDIYAPPYSLDAQAALASLPPLACLFAGGDSFVAKISGDHYVIISPDDARGPDWTSDVVPAGDEWGVSFETFGAALLRHFTRQ